MNDPQDIGNPQPNGARMVLAGNPKLTIDTQNMLDVTVLRCSDGNAPEMMPAEHALTHERSERGHTLTFTMEKMDPGSEYHVVLFDTGTTKGAEMGDVLVTLDKPRCHHAIESRPSGAKTVASIYMKSDDWRIRFGGEHFSDGLAALMRAYMK